MASDNIYEKYKADGYLIKPDTSTLLDDVRGEWRAIFGESLSVEESTPQGRIIEMETTSRKSILEICAEISNQINIDFSTGQYLDSIASLFGIERKYSTHTFVPAVELRALPGTFIPAGSKVATESGDEFYSASDVTFDAETEQTIAKVNFYAVESGPVQCPIGALTRIIDVIPGWESVSNDGACAPGEDIESDISLRNRIKKSRWSGVALIESIRSKLYELPGVRDVAICNNGTKVVMPWGKIEGEKIQVGPNSVCVVVDGGEEADIARALFDTVSTGCGYHGITGQMLVPNVADKAGNLTINYPITYNVPLPVQVKLQIVVRKNKYLGADSQLEQEIKNLILDWSLNGTDSVDAPGLGVNLSVFEVAGVISEKIPGVFVQSIKAAKGESTSYVADEILVDVAEIARFAMSDISVTIASGNESTEA